MTSRVPPAITPDVRTIHHQRTKGNTNKNSTSGSTSAAAASSSKKVVSFGLSQKESAAAPKDDILLTKEEAIRQYKLYRSKPTSFPSYDRIKLVKLPGTYLPASLLRSTTPHGSDCTINTTATNSNVYWPAIIYNNLVEVVRDLSPNETQVLKAQLTVEYKKDPTRKVARLIGWNNNGIHDDDNDTDKKKDIILFAESKLELLRLPPSSNNNTADESDETKNFCESLMDMENLYCHLLNLAKKEEKNGNTKQFAIRFGYALDMALNCLSMDVGSEPLLPRMYEECYPREEENQEIQHEQKKKKAKNNHTLDECKTPNATTTANDGVNINAVSIYGENNKHSPAEDSMFSTAAVADRDDYQHTSVVSGQHHKSTKSSTSMGTKRKKTTDVQLDTNRGAMPMTKKPEKPAATVAGRSKPPKSSTSLDKVCTEEKNVAAPTTTKSIKEKADTEVATTKVIIPWKDVWATMKRCGWSWKGGSGLMTDYYYIKPKCKITGGVSGIDYFVTVGDTMEFARRTYGWDANGMTSCTREELFSIIEEHAKYAGEVVPPLTAEMTLNPNGPWRDAWEVMLRSGWTWRAGSGLMMDYYYIKPGCKVGGGVEGQDYFIRVEDVQQFAMRNYGWRVNNGGGQGGDGVVEAEDCGATRAQTRRLSSSDDNRGATDEVPAGKRPQLESKKVPANKDGVEDATKSIKPAKAKSQEPTEEDDHDGIEGDEDETRSTFSQSGLQSKKLFSDECADEVIPPLEDGIRGDDTWSEAWKKMRDSGWSWKNGTGLMTDYFYIKPGCKIKGGVVGRDYFILLEDVQRFATRNYGWNGGKLSGSTVNNKPSMKKHHQHDDVAVMPSTQPRQSFSLSTNKAEPPSNPYEKKAQWQDLQSKGWRAINAGRYNRLHDWYYVRPCCDPGDGESKLGVDFFLCEEDAIEAAKTSDNIPAGTPQQRKEKKEEEEEVEKGGQQQQQEVAAATSPIRSARKGTPAGPLSTPQDCRTRPQDPAIPLFSSPESCSPSSRFDMYEWHNLWPALERTGWRCIKAGKYNPLHNYYYVRPTRDPGNKECVLGKHYFEAQEDVISYVKGEDRGKKDASRKSMGVMLGAFEEVADD